MIIRIIFSLSLLLLSGFCFGSEVKLIKDINTQVQFTGSNPKNFHEVNGKLMFDADIRKTGTERWITDGTTSDTTMLPEVLIGTNGLHNSEYSISTEKYYISRINNGFTNKYELHITDGSAEGSFKIDLFGFLSERLFWAHDLFDGKILLAFNECGGDCGTLLYEIDPANKSMSLLKKFDGNIQSGQGKYSSIKLGSKIYFSYLKTNDYFIGSYDESTLLFKEEILLGNKENVDRFEIKSNGNQVYVFSVINLKPTVFHMDEEGSWLKIWDAPVHMEYSGDFGEYLLFNSNKGYFVTGWNYEEQLQKPKVWQIEGGVVTEIFSYLAGTAVLNVMVLEKGLY